MKKAISILLLVCIALAAMFATSCKKSGNETTEAQAQTTTAEKPDPDIIDGVKKEYDEDGNMIKLSTYDENGNAYKDVDYTDHGRPDTHKVPHTHIIEIGEIIDRKKGAKSYAH